LCPYFALASRGKAPTAQVPRSALLADGRMARYHDQLIHGWAPPERRHHGSWPP
jgi:hypothetical protein